MKILIMCGGRGKRLGSLSEQIPKPLAELNGKTILEIKIEQYHRQGFAEIIFCVGYKGELIKKVVSALDSPIQTQFSNAGETAGILERFYHASDLFEDSVLMTYGDTFTNLDLKGLSDAHTRSDNEATIVVAPIQNPFGLVTFDQNGKVQSFKEKPVLDYYIGYAAINKSALEFVPEKVLKMTDGEGLVTFYRILAAMEKLGVFYHEGLQVTFNTPGELKAAEEKLRFFTAMEDSDE